jgi:RNA polymerase sigma-70 factor (ECF subfamily)
LLRQRRRRAYVGEWLPSPVETGDEPASCEPISLFQSSLGQPNPAAHYDMLESVSYAFLLALEALTPSQRAVLLLRDVFDYSVRETAEALGISEQNVKTTHHRARKAMNDYDGRRRPPSPSLRDETRNVLARFLACLANHDARGAAVLLATDARQISDGGGDFIAALKPISGREKVLAFIVGIMKSGGPNIRFEWRHFNGLPGLAIENPDAGPKFARHLVLRCDLNRNGEIQELHLVLATRKLYKVRPIEH